jgi:hypothetical protein
MLSVTNLKLAHNAECRLAECCYAEYCGPKCYITQHFFQLRSLENQNKCKPQEARFGISIAFSNTTSKQTFKAQHSTA